MTNKLTKIHKQLSNKQNGGGEFLYNSQTISIFTPHEYFNRDRSLDTSCHLSTTCLHKTSGSFKLQYARRRSRELVASCSSPTSGVQSSRLGHSLHVGFRGEPSGQATQALLALFILSLLAPFTVCLNTLYFNYFKGIFHTFICVFMNLLPAAGFGAEECCPLLCKLKTPQLADHQKLSFVLRTRVGGVG